MEEPPAGPISDEAPSRIQARQPSGWRYVAIGLIVSAVIWGIAGAITLKSRHDLDYEGDIAEECVRSGKTYAIGLGCYDPTGP